MINAFEKKLEKAAKKLKQKAYPIAIFLACFLLFEIIRNSGVLILNLNIYGFEFSTFCFLFAYILISLIISRALFIVFVIELDARLRKRIKTLKERR